MLIVWKSASSIPPHRRGGRIWEAFRQWLETWDFPKSKRQNKIRTNTHTHTHSRWVFVLAASSRSLQTDWQPTENKSDQSLTSSDPLRPTHRKPAGVAACVCSVVSLSGSPTLSTLGPKCPHGEGCSTDRHESGRLSCVTGERRKIEGGRQITERGREWERERRGEGG